MVPMGGGWVTCGTGVFDGGLSYSSDVLESGWWRQKTDGREG